MIDSAQLYEVVFSHYVHDWVMFPVIMEVLTSLNAAIRGTISSLADSTMNGAITIGAWAAGILYVQLGGFASIGIFSAVCIAVSLGIFLLGSVLSAGNASMVRRI